MSGAYRIRLKRLILDRPSRDSSQIARLIQADVAARLNGLTRRPTVQDNGRTATAIGAALVQRVTHRLRARPR